MLVVAPALRCGLHQVPGAIQIGVDDRVPALHRKIDRGLRKLSAGAVDQTVDAAMRADAFRFRPASSATRASSLSWLRPTTTTWAPNRANSHAIARPMPPAP